jgi:arylformamidase
MPDRLIDASRPVRTGTPVWPGDAPCGTHWTMRRSEGMTVNVCELRMSAHTGTHADGPFHVSDQGIRIGAAPLEAYLGPALLVDVRGVEAIDAGVVGRALEGRPRRVLFRTGAWTDPERFPEEFPALTGDAAARMVEAGVCLVGTDAPSVDPFDSRDLAAHQALFGGGAAVLENLLLDDLEEGVYELIALPLRLEEADASPVRAVLRRR